MTANAMTQDRENAKAAGMNDHVAKPIDVDALMTTLLKWVEHKKRDLPKGFSESINEAKAGQIGVKCYMEKPISKETLSGELRRILNKSESRNF